MAIDYIWEGQRAMPTVPYSPATGLDNANNIFYVSSRATKTQPGQWIPVGPNDGVVFETNGIQNAVQNVLNLQNTDGSVTLESTGSGSVIISGAVVPWLDVRDFGAKWDGITDDTVAIQTTITAAQMSGIGWVMFPSGKGHIAGTLQVPFSVKIQGQGHIGPNGSYLLYSGTGTALNIQGGGVFAVILQDFGIQSTGSADKGIACYLLSEAMFQNVSVGGISTSHFNTAVYLSESGDIEISHPVISFNNVGIYFDSLTNNPATPNSQVTVHDGSFFAHSEATFKINSADGIIISDNFIESCQYGVEFNNAGNNDGGTAQLVSCEGIVIRDNRFLMDDPVTGTYPVRYPLFVNGVVSKQINLSKVIFEGNDVFIAGLSPAIAYPIQFVLDAGVSFGSYAWVDLIRNMVHGQTAGLYESNNLLCQISVMDNRQLANTGTELLNETDSTVGLNANSIKIWDGTINLGNNAFESGSTVSIKDNRTTIGSTTLSIKPGPAQVGGTAFTPLLQFFDPSGNVPIGIIYSASQLFLTRNAQIGFSGIPGGQRWLQTTQGTETGSNAGTDLVFDAYSDNGVFLSQPLKIVRATGNVVINEGLQLSANGSPGTVLQDLIKGTAAFSAVTSVAVTFSSIGVSTYQVSLTAVGGQAPLWITGKSATGFTINTTPAFTGSVDWILLL